MKRKFISSLICAAVWLTLLGTAALTEDGFIDLANPSDIPGAALTNDTILISSPGTYRLTGESAECAVEVDTSGAVTLILDGVTISAIDCPAIKIENADAVTLLLADGSLNTLTSSGDCKGVIHAKADLTLTGSGSLSIENPATKGIFGKEDIVIADGTLSIRSEEDAIHGKKDITILSGDITIDTNGDGISADNDLHLKGGDLNITTHGEPVPVQASDDAAAPAEETAQAEGTDGTVYAPADGEQIIDFDSGLYSGVTVSDDTILISNGGDWRIKGTANGYSLRVETAGDVNLILDGADMSVTGTPLLYVESAGSITLTLAEGSENRVSAAGESRAVLFAKTNLTIDGTGALILTADASKGIKSMYSLIINNGTMTVVTENDAISVEEDLEINGGIISLTTGGTALAVGGVIRQNGGELAVDQPENQTAEPAAADEGPEQEASASNEGKFEYVKTWTVYDDGEIVDIGTVPAAVETDFATACKGLKAEGRIEISGGTLYLNTADHAIRSVGDMTISGGSITIASAYGKGISSHADLVIEGSDTSILITKCTEGIEGKGSLTINDGSIVIHANDDALNAGNAENESDGAVLVINGGDIEVDSMDDCIDANGILQLNGGLIKASKSKGTVVGFNAVISGEEVNINPGVSMIITVNSPGEILVDCEQTAILVYFESSHPAGETVTVKDDTGTVLTAYTLPMACSCAYMTSPELMIGSRYTVSVGEESVSVMPVESFTVAGSPAESSSEQESDGDGGFEWHSRYNGD